ncbi:MAG: hypothetical protein ACLPY2_14485 [Bryobacteraceae bacterium]|jgi:hypothetical protein
MTAVLRIVSALLGLYALWVAGMFGVSLARARQSRKRKRRYAEIEPRIRQLLIENIAGSDNVDQIRELAGPDRAAVDHVLTEFEGKVAGTARDRLCEAAIGLGVVHGWIHDTRSRDPMDRRRAFKGLAFVTSFEPCRRLSGEMPLLALNDADREVRVAAARAVLHSGVPKQFEQVFDMAMENNLLSRIRLTEELRCQALPLCEGAIPRALNGKDPGRTLVALQLLVAWERALPVENLHALLMHADPGIRANALALAPLVPASADHEAAILDSLRNTDPEVFCAAARAAARMKLANAIPLLARALRVGSAEQMRTAAAALAELPPMGLSALSDLASSENEATAAAAAEALERFEHGARLE